MVYASSLASTAAVLFATVVTIWSERSSGLKASLAGLSGHHWTTKSILVMVVYLVILAFIYLTTKNVSTGKIRKSLASLAWFTVIGFLVIFVYYIWHFYST